MSITEANTSKIHFESIDSTNAWAKRHFKEFPRNSLIVVWADEQTEGRGQFGRKWVSPPHCNLYATFCFLLPDYKEIEHMGQLLAISVAALLDRAGLVPRFKHPNDLLINRKKIAGILCETLAVDAGVAVAAGIGLNVNATVDQLEKIDQPATSMFVESGRSYEIPSLLEELTSIFRSNLNIFLSQGFEPFIRLVPGENSSPE